MILKHPRPWTNHCAITVHGMEARYRTEAGAGPAALAARTGAGLGPGPRPCRESRRPDKNKKWLGVQGKFPCRTRQARRLSFHVCHRSQRLCQRRDSHLIITTMNAICHCFLTWHACQGLHACMQTGMYVSLAMWWATMDRIIHAWVTSHMDGLCTHTHMIDFL